MATATKLLDMARSFLGVKEYPANSNNVKFNTDYYGRKVNGSQYSWCVTFIWDCFRLSNASGLFYGGKKSASATQVMNYYKSIKRTYKTPKVGDLVFFQFDKDSFADHIGFVESINADKTITTIEGNTSVTSNDNGGEVMRRVRKTNLVMTYARPKYDAETIVPDVDYSLVFNAEYYANRYLDLKSAFGMDKAKLLNHFITHGMNERRKAISTFDVNIYMKHADLSIAFGKDYKQYYLHYINFGHLENRKTV